MNVVIVNTVYLFSGIVLFGVLWVLEPVEVLKLATLRERQMVQLNCCCVLTCWHIIQWDFIRQYLVMIF